MQAELTTRSMNAHERRAWRTLCELGATETELGGLRALDLRTARATSSQRVAQLLYAFNEVVGRSGANRRHVDRTNAPVFVVTDEDCLSPKAARTAARPGVSAHGDINA
jgi:hypothetical protein